MDERLVQALIRAVVAAILAGLGVLVPWLSSEEAQSALGQWALYVPIIIGLLNGLAKFVGGATSQPKTEEGVRGVDRRGENRPNILAL